MITNRKERRKESDIKYRLEHKQEIGLRDKQYRLTHKENIRQYQKNYRLKYRKELRQKGQEFYSLHRDEYIKKHQQYYLSHKEQLRLTRKLYDVAHRDIKRATALRLYNRRKLEVLTHYGGGKCVCVKCGFSDIRALSIDHINGNGTQHRKELKSEGIYSFYVWLKQNHFPEGYRTLCMNCQWVERFEHNQNN